MPQHLARTAKLAQQFSEKFGAKSWGFTAAWLHDLGKSSKEFQGYLKYVNKINDKDVEHYKMYGFLKVDHSTAGAQYAMDRFGPHLGKLLAYVIVGHHGGLPNGKDNSHSSLVDRLQKELCPYDRELADRLKLEVKEDELPFLRGVTGFSISFFIRMLYSCLVDADFLNTESFMKPEQTGYRKHELSFNCFQSKLSEKLATFDSGASFVNLKRAEILADCLSAADKVPGIFSLTVPTGGGKTLSSLAFALKHALKYDKMRIIYVVPFTSIIEQTANEFRKILGDDAVLEHHCNFDPDKETRFSKLATENWDAPLVVTTNVQFFESLFANKSSRCRKLHNIAQSVVILDEAQMLPVSFLKPCLAAMSQLVENYSTTIVLCTATQPVLAKSDEFKAGLENVREITENPEELYESFQRVKVNVLDGVLSNEALTNRLCETEQSLCILSTKKHVRQIYESLNSPSAYHLSSYMCPQHRSDELDDIRKCLKDEEPCRVVSTQLIEAGVDVDFPRVFRSMAGLDSIAQSAGRCNREGLLQDLNGNLIKGETFVFKSEESIPSGFLSDCAEEGKHVLDHHGNAPLSLEAVKEYFERLYWRKSNEMDVKKILSDLELLERKSELLFSFKDIAQKFKLINSVTKAIIIPYKEKGRELCKEVREVDKRPESVRFLDSRTSRQVQRYSVQVRSEVFNYLLECNALQGLINDTCWVLVKEDLYDLKQGLKIEGEINYEEIF